MLIQQKNQPNKPHYLNLIKNLARFGAGSALVLVQVAILGGSAVLASRAAKQQPKQNAVRSLPNEK